MTTIQKLEKAESDLKEAQKRIAEQDQRIQAFETEKTEAVTAATGPLNTRIEEVTGQLNTEKEAHGKTKEALTKAEGDLTAANGKISDLEKNAKTASQRAVQIAAAQNTPSVEVPKNDKNADGTPKTANILEEYEAITDPSAKAAFRAKNYNALFAASRAAMKKK